MANDDSGPKKRVATHKATYPCAKWPSARLYQYNHMKKQQSEERLRNVVGLSDLPRANATAVGLYYADSPHSRESAILLASMAKDIQQQHGIRVNTAFVNSWMPLKCAQAPPCTSPTGEDCIGGCLPNDPALREENWQGLLKPSNITSDMFMLQDTRDIQIWKQFGGEMDDVLVYDSAGLVFGYACSAQSCSNPPVFSNDLTTKSGYLNVQSLILLAANSAPVARCMTKKHDPLLKHLAPTTEIEANEAFDVIVVTTVLIFGMCVGVWLLPRLWACLQSLCGLTSVETNRQKFIALSTIDDLEEDDNFDL